MQKVRCVVHHDDLDRTLTILQRAGVMEFMELTDEELSELSLTAPHHALAARLQHVLSFLSPYATKVGLWRTLREGIASELSENDIEAKARNTDGIESVVADMERLQVEIAEATDQVHDLETEHTALSRWKTLPFRLKDLTTTTTTTHLISRPSGGGQDDTLEAELSHALTEVTTPYVLTPVDADHVALTTLNDELPASTLSPLVDSIKASIETPPAGINTPAVTITEVEEKLAAAKGQLGVLYDQAEHAATVHLHTLRIAAEILLWERDRYAAVAAGRSTAHTAVLEGWLNADARTEVEAAFTHEQLAASLADIEPVEGEEPPVDIKNNALIQPFEVVTRLYGMPGYRDLDPTLFLAGFFFLFFGLSLTDVGYGAFLMVASIVILTLFKVAPVVRTFAKLLFFMGLGSFLVGLLFGGYLGIAPEALPASLQAIAVFDPIGNPLPVFYLALALGVVQVMVGMFLKIYSEYRQGRFAAGLLDQGPWLLVFFIGIAYVATVTGYLTLVTEAQLVNLIYVGLILVVLASGRNGKTLLEKVQKAALSLYDSIGYFSDILSYSRLLALGLATTALAFAVNLIAEIVSDSVPYLGPVLAIVVLVVGHLFTLAVNTLGAFIHSARLQFVEFFGKFIAGTGREFRPLRRSYRYIAVRDEK